VNIFLQISNIEEAKEGNMPMRRRYSVGEKLKKIAEITTATTRDDNPVSIRQACRDRGITATMYLKWRAKTLELLGYRRSAYKMHDGRKSSINEDHEHLLLEWLASQREQGKHVTCSMLQRALCQLDLEFQAKTDNAQRLVILRWSKHNSYVYRASTHTAQNPPAEEFVYKPNSK
jgi:hypothetical protein